MSIISAGTTLTTGLVLTSDTNGNLVIKTGSAAVTSATFKSNGSLVVAGLLSASSASLTTVTGTTATFTSANITTVTGTTGTFTTSSDANGNLRNIPSAGAAKTSEYTLTVSDIGEFITISTSGKVLVPNNTFSTGNAVSVYNDTTGNVSINISTTTGYVVGTNTNRTGVTLATRGIANILFINSSYCILSGNLT